MIAGEKIKSGSFVMLGDDGLVHPADSSGMPLGVSKYLCDKGAIVELMSSGTIIRKLTLWERIINAVFYPRRTRRIKSYYM